MDLLTRLGAQAEQAEVMTIHSRSTRVGFEANRCTSSQTAERSGIAVRVIREGKLGFAASSDEKAIDKLVNNALESATCGDKTRLCFPALQPAPHPRTYDPTIARLSAPRLVEIGQQIVDTIVQIEPSVQLKIEITSSVQRVSLRNHSGAEINWRRSPLSISIAVSRVRADDVLLMSQDIGTTIWDKEYLLAARKLGEKLEQSNQSASLRSRKMPVLFAPAGTLVLGLPLMAGLNGENVYKGVSPLTGRIGQPVFDAQLGIVDDATLDGKFNSAPYDDEGIPHQRTVLVERGVLKDFLYDLRTAAQFGVTSTGNGLRGLFSPPKPGPTNLIWCPGDTCLSDMVADIKEGLLVENALGLGQGNLFSGAFSKPLSVAFKIEKGEIVGRVKSVSIAGNAYDLLREVAAVSKEREWIYRSLYVPYILLPAVSVITTS